MSTEEPLGPYIREINVIIQSMLTETDSYSRYRAIGEGFVNNVEWLEETSPPSISFFNGLTAMLNLAVVMSVWKITEPLSEKKGQDLPGEVLASQAGAKRRAHDEIRSLPRLAALFRKAFGQDPASYRVWYSQRQNEIIREHNLPQRDMQEYEEKIAADRHLLLEYCDRIDTLIGQEVRHKLDMARNEGFAHSAAISRKTIAADMDPDTVDFSRSVLFEFGDEAMQLARDFEAVWNQRGSPSIKDIIEVNVLTGRQFWQGAKNGLASIGQERRTQDD